MSMLYSFTQSGGGKSFMFNLKAFLNLNYYTSHLDEFLAKFDLKQKKPSQSQQKEIDKYNRVHSLRDQEQKQAPIKSDIWDKF